MPGSPLPLLGPDPARPRAVTLVGRYALGVTWEDGHGSIYPFPALRALCPCGACGAEPTAWPAAVHRAAAALHVAWTDGHASELPYRELRRRCGCAACARVPGGSGR